MPQYEWQRSDPFRDHANEREVSEGEVVELSETIAGPNPGFERIEEESSSSDVEETEADESYVCGAELASGGECSREVDTPDGKCWDHSEE